jgi:hypothetical protein
MPRTGKESMSSMHTTALSSNCAVRADEQRKLGRIQHAFIRQKISTWSMSVMVFRGQHRVAPRPPGRFGRSRSTCVEPLFDALKESAVRECSADATTSSMARELVMIVHGEAADDAWDDYEAGRTSSLEKMPMSLMFFELDA